MTPVLALALLALASPSTEANAEAGAKDPLLGYVQSQLQAPNDTAAIFDLKHSRFRLLHHPKTFYDMRIVPGSVMKLFSTYALLLQNLDQHQMRCTGRLQAKNKVERRCWLHEGHGLMTLRRAVAESCNLYFIDVSKALPPEVLEAAFSSFGLLKDGSEIRFDPQFASRLKRRSPMAYGDLLIGDHGGFLLTPAQILGALTVIATKTMRYDFREKAWKKAKLDPSRLEFIEETMREAAQTGTLKASLRGLDVAAKSGTGKKFRELGTHGMVIGYWPTRRPRYLFLVKKAEGRAATDVGPIVRELLTRLKAEGSVKAP